MSAANGMNKTSGNTEWYTPHWIIDRVKKASGVIDLDPASCAEANRYIGARAIYTKVDDGLSRNWFGNVWVNHPYGRASNAAWSQKIIGEYFSGSRVKNITGICYASPSERWCHDIIKNASAICFLSPRVRFLDENGNPGNSPQKGAMLYYFGSKPQIFRSYFHGGLDNGYLGICCE